MIKNAIISVLAAVLAVDKFSKLTDLTASEQIGLWIAFAGILIIFCIFLEDKAEKWRKRRIRVQRIRELLERLRRRGGLHLG